MNINGSVAVVTGGGTGLGLATVRVLHEAGAMVVIVGRSPLTGEAAADSFGERAVFARADVTNEEQVGKALDLAAECGPVRVVVNCAGVIRAGRVVGRDGPCPLADFARIIEVNLIGTFNVTRLAAARMSSNKLLGEERGVIVNTASIAAFEGQIGQAAYAASKGGVVAMTLPLARELAEHRIRVNTIAPGPFDTPLLDPLPESKRSSLSEAVPHPSRLGHPVEFAVLAAHLVENPMLNGESVRLDGALRMPPR
ncbi:putative oxidoreductase Rv1144/MT1177 [Candidatus Protofrankia californiensis]|uniref:Putative oxidoreductase Rv1144/MT1177 n=1 Tax=Candidatus Protofrankia californiensis TaxID=1839754 RepID=A0A1C3P3S2_9ACTN|nr:putative oxidoreductase Rv1144/MT1177 [Candidatus Protofrankia californiensis]